MEESRRRNENTDQVIARSQKLREESRTCREETDQIINRSRKHSEKVNQIIGRSKKQLSNSIMISELQKLRNEAK